MIVTDVDDTQSEQRPGNDTAFRSWRIPQCSFRIDCSAALLDTIRLEVETGRNLPGGGLEVGGVLFGTEEAGVVSLLAARPLEIERAFGHGFVLSERDEKRLQQLLAAPSTDPALNGLRALGWYHSHLRSKVFLSERDRQVHARHFGAAHQIALVIHPRSDSFARAGFFFQEPDGKMRTEAPYEEFTIEPPPAPKEAKRAPAPARPESRKRAAPEKTESHEETICPKCGSHQIRRSRRTGPVERVYGAFGYYPFRCSECLSRSFVKIASTLELARSGRRKRPEERKRAWMRTRREILLWGGGIFGFLAILYYIIRDTGPKQEQP